MNVLPAEAVLAFGRGDIDFSRKTLSVRRAIVYGRLTTPKSKTSRRTIQLGPVAVATLQAHFERTAYKAADDFVFGHPFSGRPTQPLDLARFYLRPALKRAGITKPFRPYHDMRHTLDMTLAMARLIYGHERSCAPDREGKVQSSNSAQPWNFVAPLFIERLGL